MIGLPDTGERQPAIAPQEQLGVQSALELPDLLADRGLADAQFLARDREAQMPPGGLECPERVETGALHASGSA
jgi:hypothetical protein